MLTALVDYDSGNLHSARKAFERMAAETGGGEVIVTSRPEDVLRADRIVLPGDGAFPACRRALTDHTGLFEAIAESAITRARPFLGICVGMQMLAARGFEYEVTDGFGWIGGEVVRIAPDNAALKVPHMGWNDLVLDPGAEAHPAGRDRDRRSRLFRPLLAFSRRNPVRAAGACRLWRRNYRHRGARQYRRHPVPPGEKPADRPAPHRKLSELAALRRGGGRSRPHPARHRP